MNPELRASPNNAVYNTRLTLCRKCALANAPSTLHRCAGSDVSHAVSAPSLPELRRPISGGPCWPNKLSPLPCNSQVAHARFNYQHKEEPRLCRFQLNDVARPKYLNFQRSYLLCPGKTDNETGRHRGNVVVERCGGMSAACGDTLLRCLPRG